MLSLLCNSIIHQAALVSQDTSRPAKTEKTQECVCTMLFFLCNSIIHKAASVSKDTCALAKNEKTQDCECITLFVLCNSIIHKAACVSRTIRAPRPHKKVIKCSDHSKRHSISSIHVVKCILKTDVVSCWLRTKPRMPLGAAEWRRSCFRPRCW